MDKLDKASQDGLMAQDMFDSCDMGEWNTAENESKPFRRGSFNPITNHNHFKAEKCAENEETRKELTVDEALDRAGGYRYIQ